MVSLVKFRLSYGEVLSRLVGFSFFKYFFVLQKALACDANTGLQRFQLFKSCLHWRRLHDNAGDSDTHY
jgi:hypothetical protein